MVSILLKKNRQKMDIYFNVLDSWTDYFLFRYLSPREHGDPSVHCWQYTGQPSKSEKLFKPWLPAHQFQIIVFS